MATKGNNIKEKAASDLTPLISPKSVAIYGSFRESILGGYTMVKELQNFGYQGKIYPINPRYDRVLGIKVYPSVKEVPEVDQAIMMIPAQSVLPVLEECAEKGVRTVVIVADGFAEKDKEGAELQKKAVDIAKRAGMRILGPNTAGIVNIKERFNPCPFECGYANFKGGGIALIVNTGIANPQSVPWGDLQYGIGKIIDLGNTCDVDECDILEYLANDPETKVVGMYLESIRKGRRFIKLAREVTKKKPILVLKSGRTPEGAKAAASHTASLAGNERVIDVALKQAGVIRIERWSELFSFTNFLECQPVLKGNRVGIVSVTGGAGIMLTDAAWGSKLKVAEFSMKTSEQLNKIFPTLGANPVDYGPPVESAPIENVIPSYKKILETVLADDNVDCVATTVWVPTDVMVQGYIEMYEDLKRNITKPIAIWLYGPRLPLMMKLSHHLNALGFPVFTELEDAVKVLGIALKYLRIVRPANWVSEV